MDLESNRVVKKRTGSQRHNAKSCPESIGEEKIVFFCEMMEEAGSCDHSLVGNISEGFDLMGEIKGNPFFPKRPTYATSDKDQVRATASITRQGILHEIETGVADGVAPHL